MEDWRVLGLLSAGQGGDHGRRLSTRDHYRLVYHTPEVQSPEDRDKLKRARAAMDGLPSEEGSAAKNWYKTGVTDIAVLEEQSGRTRPLSEFSNVVKNLGQNDQVLLYSTLEDRQEATRRIVEAINGLG